MLQAKNLIGKPPLALNIATVFDRNFCCLQNLICEL